MEIRRRAPIPIREEIRRILTRPSSISPIYERDRYYKCLDCGHVFFLPKWEIKKRRCPRGRYPAAKDYGYPVLACPRCGSERIVVVEEIG